MNTTIVFLSIWIGFGNSQMMSNTVMPSLATCERAVEAMNKEWNINLNKKHYRCVVVPIE